jgi:hypothetical protein
MFTNKVGAQRNDPGEVLTVCYIPVFATNNNNILLFEAVPKLQFWGDKLRKAGNLRFNGKSGPDFSPIRPLFPKACSIANKVCAPCASAHSRLVLEQAHVSIFTNYRKV